MEPIVLNLLKNHSALEATVQNFPLPGFRRNGIRTSGVIIPPVIKIWL